MKKRSHVWGSLPHHSRSVILAILTDGLSFLMSHSFLFFTFLLSFSHILSFLKWWVKKCCEQCYGGIPPGIGACGPCGLARPAGLGAVKWKWSHGRGIRGVGVGGGIKEVKGWGGRKEGHRRVFSLLDSTDGLDLEGLSMGAPLPVVLELPSVTITLHDVLVSTVTRILVAHPTVEERERLLIADSSFVL